MARIVVTEFLTLDGVMQGPGGSEEDQSGGFEHGGWQVPYWDDIGNAAVDDAMKRTGALLLGRRTYEIFAGYWPTATEDRGMAEQLNSRPKYVVSTTLREPLRWSGSMLISENVPEAIANVKATTQEDLIVYGSGELVRTLIEHDLVDEFLLMIHPVVLGSGKRLFQEGLPKRGLKLVDSAISSTGTLIGTYVPERPK